MSRNKKVIIVLVLLISLMMTKVGHARNLAFENYKQAVMAFESQDWSQAKQHLDQVILNDLAYSDYMAKSVYLKSLLLAAEIERDIKLKEAFIAGEEKLDFAQEDLREKFKMQADNYQLQAKRKVDTLLGLANYLAINLPPVEIDIDLPHNRRGYDQQVLEEIESGEEVAEDNLKELEERILMQGVYDYLNLTVGTKTDIFDNNFVIRAEEGDSLFSLAREHNIPLQLLVEVNNHLQNPNRIYPEQKIYIPQVENYYINYPAYFYYLSYVSYQANQRRKEEISELVEKAYQLTAKDDGPSLGEESKGLVALMRLDEYEQRITEKTKTIEELESNYQFLLQEVEELTLNLNEEELEDEKEEKEEESDFDPTQEPLDY
ncbi:LysM peptidoglycan-binding domain-containing protein [Natroniella sulfidigena]|uniref:LysM peptidoglycan-binding domain-containing protein n=1 Tax=Natroniella sulfidigena TaxID=723921 RepID=UPI00200AE7EB|nr:LysM peptidoglycan-binding domain-containing protein [Natroniella sulfidigena]